MPDGEAARRIRSIDILRGLACVLMAIDHVRVYSGIPAGGPAPEIFLTRWITHFVAPAFCFFAGTGAFFMGQSSGDRGALSRFLVARGLLLVLMEMTLMRFAWSFNVGTDFMLAGVIWMLGWCMVLLGLVVRLPARWIGWSGVGIVMAQQLFGVVPRLGPLTTIAPLWNYIYPAGSDTVLGGINILYVIVPSVGLMMAGYGFGLLFDREPGARDRRFLRIGLGMTAAWLVLGLVRIVVMRDSGEAAASPVWMQLLNQQKYPASQVFLLMTIGPLIALLPWASRAKGVLADALDTFGRVPMFYYIAHLFVIHLLAILTMRVSFGSFDPTWYATAPYTQIPPERRWNLGVLYLVWAVAVVVLYGLCRWYARRKREAPAWWMAYL
jgi:uncharacterized membrane protein